MVMTLNGLAKLTEEIGELIQVVGKKIAYTDGTHPDGKGDLNSRMQEEMGDVIAAIRFVFGKLELDIDAVNAIAEYELTPAFLNGLPQLVRSLGSLSYSASDMMISIIHTGEQEADQSATQKMAGIASLQYEMGLSLASIKLVAKSLNLDQQAINNRIAKKIWQYEAWDRQKP